jgi:hypothetical protein
MPLGSVDSSSSENFLSLEDGPKSMGRERSRAPAPPPARSSAAKDAHPYPVFRRAFIGGVYGI